MSWKMESGYAYSYVKGEGWVDVMVSSHDVDTAKFIGFRQIDGSRMGVFRLGRRTVAQLAQNLVPVTEREVGRTRGRRAKKSAKKPARRKAAKRPAKRAAKKSAKKPRKHCAVKHKVEHVVSCRTHVKKSTKKPARSSGRR